jgi:hypothetical protein
MIQLFLLVSLVSSGRSFMGNSKTIHQFVLPSVGLSSSQQQQEHQQQQKYPSRSTGSILSSATPPIRTRATGALSSSPVSSSALWTTTMSNAVDVYDDGGYDAFENANRIEPQTKTLPQSMAFYAKFLVNYFIKQQPNPMLMENTSKMTTTTTTTTTAAAEAAGGGRRAMWRKLNEQRRNVVTLAGYTRHIVAPSFGFLLLGALMSSIVPSYWGKCIQIVATLTASKAELLEAVIGLGVTCTLAALFTGIRGSLFWIGGTFIVYIMV